MQMKTGEQWHELCIYLKSSVRTQSNSPEVVRSPSSLSWSSTQDRVVGRERIKLFIPVKCSETRQLQSQLCLQVRFKKIQDFHECVFWFFV